MQLFSCRATSISLQTRVGMGGAVTILTNAVSSSPTLSLSSSSSESAYSLSLRYEYHELIGRGATCSVMKSCDLKTKLNVAIKRVKLITSQMSQEQAVNFCLKELNTFKRISTSHPFIVTLQVAFYFRSSCYFVMDNLVGGDLRRFMRLSESKMTEESIGYVVGCIGSALHHLHSHGIIHRDIKPENIVFDIYGRPFLTDFGISEFTSQEDHIPICSNSSGTLTYLAPEVLVSSSNHHSYQADYWSLGVVAYELYYHDRPWKKHCGIPFIQFSGNEYSGMWNELVSWPYSPAFNTDFESIYQNSNNLKVIKFPQCPLRPNQDGTVPSCLTIPIPGEVSPHFRSLLQGLLDIRIPQRLGNYLNYTEFSEHPFFIKSGYLLDQLHRINSPLQNTLIPLDLTRNSLLSAKLLHDHDRDLNNDFTDNDDNAEEEEKTISGALEKKLLEFHFIKPEKDGSLGRTIYRKLTADETTDA